MQKFIPYIYIAFFLWNIRPAFGQEFTLKISGKDSIHAVFLNSIKYQTIHKTEFSLRESLDSIKNKLEEKGFLNYTLDTLTKNDSIYDATFNLGNLRNVVRIYYEDKEISKEQLFNITSLVTDNYLNIQIEQLSQTLNSIVEIFENQGKSFTEVSLKNIILKKNFIEATLEIKKSDARKIDKIEINGYENFPRTYLDHFLQVKNNTLFNRVKLDKASGLIKTLPFVSEIKPPEILFTKDSTIVYLFLKKEVSNKFDGLIGFTSKETGSGVSFNGYLDLSLNNIFNSGESFSLFWKNNGNERQDFTLSTTIPFFFNTGFSINAALNIYKQDSTFVNSKTKFTIPYLLNERHAIGLSFQTESSSNLLENSSSSDILDFSTVFYGVNYNYQISNQNTLFPIKLKINTELLTGGRKIDGNFNQQSRIYLKSHYLWSLNLRNHFFIQNESSTLLSDSFLINELYRIGGVNSIRGFNEESILASTYSFFTVEYRFSPNNSSYLYSITDLGYFDNRNINKSSQIYSLGLGYAFRTKLGLLNLSYAIGKLSDQQFDLNNSKFHIKVISFF